MKILLFDIEVSPLTLYSWGLFNQNHSIDKIIDSSYVLCWAAKWLGKDPIMFDSVYQNTHKKMLKSLYKLLEEADVVIWHNGIKFDQKRINTRFLKNGLTPPMSYQQIDTLLHARKRFNITSNKLDYIGKFLGLGDNLS